MISPTENRTSACWLCQATFAFANPSDRRVLQSLPTSHRRDGLLGNRQVVERYAKAHETDDFDGQDACLHDDYVLIYPQSGEQIRGAANRRAIVEGYPGKEMSGTRPIVGRVIGTDDQFVTAPSWPGYSVIHLAGSGDEFQATGTVRYPNGEEWHWISLMTMRSGKIWRETQYFAPTFHPPSWRSPYVEATD
jgi:hypothetical protein